MDDVYLTKGWLMVQRFYRENLTRKSVTAELLFDGKCVESFCMPTNGYTKELDILCERLAWEYELKMDSYYGYAYETDDEEFYTARLTR